ncbi:MAG: hypothetical protein U9N08_07990 [Candidatus Caldatribacteriota bacterium]|nr:hypothetical protein [Candidatus Caldatribacteriota bacterium]
MYIYIVEPPWDIIHRKIFKCFIYYEMLGVEKRVNRTTTILVTGSIIGVIMFLGFFLTSFYGYSLLGIQPLEGFLAMCGLLTFLICGFFLISLNANRHQT